jgi:actin related protein 2/3 complex subunit 2
MILLEVANKILEETLTARLNSEKKESVDITFADFDGVQFHVTTNPEAKNLLNVSIQLKGGQSILQEGGLALLKKYYGNLVQPTHEQGYDVTLQVDLDKPPGKKEDLPFQIALLKRHLFAAPFQKVFEQVESKAVSSDVLAIKYRPEEAVYIKPEGDRVIVIFDILFRDADDIVFSKVFLQEFADARRTISNAPSVTFSQKEPPLELKGVKGVKAAENNGFVSFVLFAGHISAKNRDKTIDLIQTFRDYLHYHIKCSKAYMHTRMRNRVESLLQILNRARPEPVEVVKRTAQGKTFKRVGKQE